MMLVPGCKVGSYVIEAPIKGDLYDATSGAQRVLCQVRSTAAQPHARLLPILEQLTQGGKSVLILPFYPGSILSQWLAASPAPSQRRQVWEQLSQIIQALQHDGYAHGEISASSVWVADGPIVHVLPGRGLRESTTEADQQALEQLRALLVPPEPPPPPSSPPPPRGFYIDTPWRRTRVVPILAVSRLHKEKVAMVFYLTLTLRRGTGRVTCEATALPSVVKSVENAIYKGLGSEIGRWNVSWKLNAPITGESLGLSVAVGTLAARRRQQIPKNTAFSAELAEGENLAAVDDIGVKLQAAVREGFTRILIAAQQPLQAPANLEVVGVKSLTEAMLKLGQPPLRWDRIGLLVGTLCGAPMAIALGLMEKPDLWLGSWLLWNGWIGDGYLEAKNTVVIPVPWVEANTTPNRQLLLRAEHARLIRALLPYQPRAILFDLSIQRESEGDEALAAAIEAATQQHIPVVFPVTGWTNHREPPKLAGAPGLAAAVTHWGTVEINHTPEGSSSKILHIRAREYSFLEEKDYWHFAVLGALSALDAGEPSIQGQTLRLGTQERNLSKERVFISPVQEIPRLPYVYREAEWTKDAIQGRVVLVGVMNCPDPDNDPACAGIFVEQVGASVTVQQCEPPCGWRSVPKDQDQWKLPHPQRKVWYGVELHAMAIETLIQNRLLQVLPTSTHVERTGVVMMLTVGLSLLLPRWREQPVGGLIVLPVALWFLWERLQDNQLMIISAPLVGVMGGLIIVWAWDRRRAYS